MCHMYHCWANDVTRQFSEWSCCGEVHPRTDKPGWEHWREVRGVDEQNHLRRTYTHVDYRGLFVCEPVVATVPVSARTVHSAPFGGGAVESRRVA